MLLLLKMQIQFGISHEKRRFDSDLIKDGEHVIERTKYIESDMCRNSNRTKMKQDRN